MDDDMYYEYICTMLDIRLSSGMDELSAKRWTVDAEVRQWEGDGGSFFVRVLCDELVRASITPDDAVDDKEYPYHIQLGHIGEDKATVCRTTSTHSGIKSP